jgi:hypothetical protein
MVSANSLQLLQSLNKNLQDVLQSTQGQLPQQQQLQLQQTAQQLQQFMPQ